VIDHAGDPPMNEIEHELEQGKIVFELMRTKVSEEWLRKVQTMLNHGFSNERLLGKLDWSLSPKPEDAKMLMYAMFAYMRQEMPVAPWRGR